MYPKSKYIKLSLDRSVHCENCLLSLQIKLRYLSKINVHCGLSCC